MVDNGIKLKKRVYLEDLGFDRSTLLIVRQALRLLSGFF